MLNNNYFDNVLLCYVLSMYGEKWYLTIMTLLRV